MHAACLPAALLLVCLAARALAFCSLLFDFCAFCLCSALGAPCSEQRPNEEKPATINRCRHIAAALVFQTANATANGDVNVNVNGKCGGLALAPLRAPKLHLSIF